MELTRKNLSVDTAKGGLMLLVMLGHVLPGALDESFARFFIYSFHMPMFLFVSGWLVNLDKLAGRTPGELVRHYAGRMLGWWAAAWLVYTSIALPEGFTARDVARLAVWPYYHLWYVPSLFCMICLTYITRRACGKRHDRLFWTLLFGTALVFLCLATEFRLPSIARFSLSGYFFLGVLYRNKQLKTFKIGGGKCWAIYSAAAIAVWLSARELLVIGWIHLLMAPFAAALTLCWLYPSLKDDNLPRSPMLAFWGRQSLHIYLWHVLPIIALKHWLGEGSPAYLATCAALMAAFALLSLPVAKGSRENRTANHNQLKTKS